MEHDKDILSVKDMAEYCQFRLQLDNGAIPEA
jgi:hypothetical protein